VAALGLQAAVTAYLCYLKVEANKVLADGGKTFVPFFLLLSTIDWAGALLGLIFLLVAFMLPPQRWVDDLAAWLGGHIRMVAACVVAALSVMSLVAHHAYPFTMDEYAPFFQSQVFAAGRLVGQWPPQVAPLLVAPEDVGTFLETSFVTGQVCSGYWPGHAILLTPFTALGIPWALNPALAGCAILLLSAVVRRTFSDRAVGWAVLFTLASPIFAAYGISFYATMAHLTCNLLYAWLLLSPTVPRVAAAGLVGGFALVLHNPFPHFVFALPWLGWLTLRRDRWTRLPVIALCYAAAFLPLDVGWRHVEQAIRGNRPATVFAAASGITDAAAGQPPVADASASPPAAAPAGNDGVSAFVAPIARYFSVIELPSLGALLWGRCSAFLRLVAWDAPGLVVMACWGFWRNRHATPARLFALSGLSTFFGYSLIAMSGGHGWGYRYFFSAWSCLPVLAAGLAEAEAGSDRGDADSRSVADVLRAAGLAAVLSLAICLPVRLWQIHGFIVEHLAQMPPQPPDMRFVEGDIVSFLDPARGYFRSDLVRNDPFFRRGPYMLVSQGAENDRFVIEKLAEAAGMQARMVAADKRGSTWVLQPRAPQEQVP
jgi:uncharacterized membrane protein (UPF0136 family)